MSKTLYLLRHGQAEGASAAGFSADHERELSAQGRDDIDRLGLRLAQREDFAPQAALVSSAIRTRQTAQRIPLSGMDIRDDYYNADLDALIAPIRALPEHVNSALVVAHNPGISWFGASLLQPQPCSGFSPGGMLAVQFDGVWRQIKPGCAQILWRLDPPNY